MFSKKVENQEKLYLDRDIVVMDAIDSVKINLHSDDANSESDLNDHSSEEYENTNQSGDEQRS